MLLYFIYLFFFSCTTIHTHIIHLLRTGCMYAHIVYVHVCVCESAARRQRVVAEQLAAAASRAAAFLSNCSSYSLFLFFFTFFFLYSSQSWLLFVARPLLAGLAECELNKIKQVH